MPPTRRAQLRSTLDSTFLIADSVTIIQSLPSREKFYRPAEESKAID
jgi:hypothetical protein